MSEFDNGKWYVSRGEGDYSQMLFPDDPTGNVICNWFMKGKIRQFHGDSLAQISLQGDQLSVRPSSFPELKKILGGRREFFKAGGVILDLGCGVGKAVNDMYGINSLNETKVLGIDTRFREDPPLNPQRGHFIEANWISIPLSDNSITGILGCESFPKNTNPDSEECETTIGEVTRIAQVGAIWRGTLMPDFTSKERDRDGINLENEYDYRGALAVILLKYGWNVFMGSRVMVARLENKPT